MSCDEDVIAPFTATLYWMRHGHSCANSLERTIKWPMIVATGDTILSDTGVKQSKAANKNIPQKFDILVCSKLRRAVETAMFAFNDPNVPQNLFVVPYIGELRNAFGKITGLDRSNIPSSKEELCKYIGDLKAKDNLNITLKTNLLDTYQDEDTPDYNKFITKILPRLHTIVGKNEFTVGIVSHSLFIMDHIAKDHKIDIGHFYGNTEMWYETIEFINNKPKCVKNTEKGCTFCKYYCDGNECPIQKPQTNNIPPTRCKHHSNILFGGGHSNKKYSNKYYAEYSYCKNMYHKLKNE